MAQFIESLLLKHLSEFGGIDFMPPYQREYVWTDSDKEQLLDSIFMGSDIGKFTVRVLDDVEWFERQLSYEIIDGKQRLMTLLNFYLNRFPYKGFYYNGLSAKDRRTFLDHTISWAKSRTSTKKPRFDCSYCLTVADVRFRMPSSRGQGNCSKNWKNVKKQKKEKTYEKHILSTES